MAKGNLVGGTPSSVTVGGTAIPNCVGASINRRGQNHVNHVDDLAEPMDGGNVNNEPAELTLDFRIGKASADTVHPTASFVEGADPGALVVVRAGKGIASPQTLTATIADPRVSGNSETDDGGRGRQSVTLQCFSPDGTTKPVIYAWS